MEQLEKQVLDLVKERNDRQIKIDWQLPIQNARTKLSRHYNKVNDLNKNINKLS